MGYRSEVKIITTEQGWQKLDAAVRKASGITPENENDKFWLTDKTHFYKDEKWIIGEWNDYKWYDDMFPDVAAFMATLSELDNEDIPYEFLRLGEDWGDYDYQKNDDHFGETRPHLEYVRAISIEDY